MLWGPAVGFSAFGLSEILWVLMHLCGFESAFSSIWFSTGYCHNALSTLKELRAMVRKCGSTTISAWELVGNANVLALPKPAIL